MDLQNIVFANSLTLQKLNLHQTYDIHLKPLNGVQTVSEEVLQNTLKESKKTVAQNIVRKQRQSLLIQTDWMVLPDTTIANKPEWIQYRQELRDIISDNPDLSLDENGKVINVTWPEKPQM